MKRLLILRHAKSSWTDSSITDWQRPLNERGLRDAPRAGEWLREHSRVPDLIITSDAVRARTTAELVARSAGYAREIVVEPSLYLATPDTVLALLNDVKEPTASVMIVGHNPGLEDLVAMLSGEHHGLRTTALAHLSMAINRWDEIDNTTPASIVDTWEPG